MRREVRVWDAAWPDRPPGQCWCGLDGVRHSSSGVFRGIGERDVSFEVPLCREHAAGLSAEPDGLRRALYARLDAMRSCAACAVGDHLDWDEHVRHFAPAPPGRGVN